MKTIYIILGIAAVGVAAWLIFGNKKAAAADGSALPADSNNTGTWLTNFGKTDMSNSFNSWQDWFADRQANNWVLNTKLL